MKRKQNQAKTTKQNKQRSSIVYQNNYSAAIHFLKFWPFYSMT